MKKATDLSASNNHLWLWRCLGYYDGAVALGWVCGLTGDMSMMEYARSVRSAVCTTSVELFWKNYQRVISVTIILTIALTCILDPDRISLKVIVASNSHNCTYIPWVVLYI